MHALCWHARWDVAACACLLRTGERRQWRQWWWWWWHLERPQPLAQPPDPDTYLDLPRTRPRLQIDSITIPVGPRLGNKVVDAKGVAKAFGERLLVDDLNFSIPPGAIVVR